VHYGIVRSLTTLKPCAFHGCYIARSTREVMTMQHYNNSLKAAATFNTYFVNAALEYWRAMAYPALYYAKYL
jgi:hypothetical protein